MILKMAAKELDINRKLYTFILVQLCITFFIAISFVSVIEIEYEKYKALLPCMEEDGWIFQISYLDTWDGKPVCGTEYLEKHLKSAHVYGGSTVYGYFSDGDNPMSVSSIVYDTEIMDAYVPELSEGRWLKETDSETDEIEVVITPGNKNIQVGDCLFLHDYDGKLKEEPITVRIVGVLREDASFCGVSYSKDAVNYQNLFQSVDTQKPALLMGYEDVKNAEYRAVGHEGIMGISGNAFVVYEKGITEEEQEYNMEFLNTYGSYVWREELSSALHKSRVAFARELGKYVPVIACGWLLTVISSLCVGIVVSKRQWKNLSVYQMLGLPWSQCIKIQSASYLLLMGEAFFLAAAAVLLIRLFHVDLAIRLGPGQLFSCIGIALFCLGMMAVQSLFFKKEKPYELWNKEQG